MRNLFTRRQSARHQQNKKARRRRLFVEQLEDRRVLSTVSIDSPVAVDEGNTITFTVTRTAADGTGTVNYSVASGTATLSADFSVTPASGTLTFNNPDLTQQIVVTTADDRSVEALTENFTVTLSTPGSVITGITTAVGNGSITDNDSALVTYSGTANTSESGTTDTLTATLSLVTPGSSGSPQLDVPVSATLGVDADFTASTAMWAAAEVPGAKSITVTAVDDNRVEVTSEALTGTLSASSTATVNTAGSAAVNVAENDQAQLAITADAPSSRAEGSTFPSTVTLTVTPGTGVGTPGIDEEVTVKVDSNDGTGGVGMDAFVLDSDYTDISPTLTFTAATDTPATMPVNVSSTDDARYELDESFTVDLTNATFDGGAEAARATIITSSATGTITNNDFAINETGGAGDDTLAVTITNATTGSFVLTLAGVVGPTIAFNPSTITSLTFNGGNGDDQLIINNPATGLFAPSGGIFFHGQDETNSPDGDTLTINGGTATTTTYRYTDANNGFIDYNGTLAITYTDLEPITSTITATNVILNYSTATEIITVTDPGGSSTKVDSTDGETTTFSTPSGTLTINGGITGDDTVNIDGLAAPYPANIVIDGQGPTGTDIVNINAPVSLAVDKSLTVSSDTINLPNMASDVSTSGTGTVMLTAGQDIDIDAGASILTAAGAITLVANSAGTTVGNFKGIDVREASITSTSGAITLTGKGGMTDLFGINTGIELRQSTITSATGLITLTGEGGDTGDENIGVDIMDVSVVSSTGALAPDPAIIINGAGGGSISAGGSDTGNENYGVRIEDLGTDVTSLAGDISITGTSNGISSTNYGVFVNSGADVESSGAATITIDGTGGDGTVRNHGVVITGTATTVTSVDGAIGITGRGGAASVSNSVGITMSGTGSVVSTGMATITMVGTGGRGIGDDNVGVEVFAASITSDDGAIDITGTGGTDIYAPAGEGGGQGVLIASTATINATDGGVAPTTITIKGNAHPTPVVPGLGDGTQAGIDVLDGTINSEAGSVTLTAEDDVDFGAAGLIDSDSGTVTVTADNAAGDLGGVIDMADMSKIDAGSGTIDLNSDGDATLGALTTTGAVTVDSTSGSILDGGNTDKEIVAATALLKAADDIGTGADSLETDINKLEATAGVSVAGGGIWIENAGGIELGDVDAGTTGVLADGTIKVVDTSGSIKVSEKVESQRDATADSVTLDAATTIAIEASVLSGNGAVTVDAGTDLSFSAAGSIDTESTSTAKVDIDAGGMISMTDGSMVDAWGGEIEMDATGAISISLLRSSDRVTIVTTGGAVTDVDAGTGADVNRLGELVIDAALGIATSGNPLDTEVTDLEAHGGTGGVFVINTGGLTISDLDTTIEIAGDGVTADGDIIITAMSPMSVEADVVSATEDVLLTATDSAATGDNLSVLAGVTVESTLKTVTLRAGDNLTLEDSSTVTAPVSTILLQGDFGNADAGVGSTISLFGTLNASGTSGSITVEGNADDDTINVNPDPNLTGVAHTADGLSLDGKAGDDTYRIWNGRLNGGASAVTVVEAGPAMDNNDVVIVEGTDDVLPAGETFNVDGQMGGTVENTTHGETVTYPLGVERLIVRGNGGNDTMTGSAGADVGVEPSFTTTITIDGGAPGFGEAFGPGGALPDGPGDIMIFDSLGGIFQIIGKSIFTDGDGDLMVMGAGDYKGVGFRRIESLPLIPTGTDTLRFDMDFDDVSPVTEATHTSVAPLKVYDPGTNGSPDFGWDVPLLSSGYAQAGGFDRGAGSTAVLDDLLRDGHFSDADRTFTADIASGWYLVSIKTGDTMFARDNMRVTDVDTGQVLLDNVASAAGQFNPLTFVVQVTDESLDLEFSTGPSDPFWVLNSIEIRPGKILTIGSPDPASELEADGVTEDLFLGFEATPGSLITISAGIDSNGDDIPDADLAVLSADVAPDIAGIQVLADGDGEYSYTIRRPLGRGTGFVKMEEVGGDQTGCLAVDYVAPEVRRFDFNMAGSPTQAPVSSIGDPTGYIDTTTNVFTLGSGFGWLTPVTGAFDRIPGPGAQTELRRDGHYGVGAEGARTFRTELEAGTHLVNVTIGDRNIARDNIELRANGIDILTGADSISTAAGESFHAAFPITIVAGGMLDLEISDTGGDPFWVINGMEIRREGLFAPITLAVDGAPTLPLPGDGSTIDTIDGTLGAPGVPDGTLVTVSTTLGTVVSTDLSSAYAGVQVEVTGDMFSYDILRPLIGGAPMLTAATIDGSAYGTLTDPATLVYSFAPVRRYDFNGGANDTETTTTPIFEGVRAGTLYTASTGFGFTTSGFEFERSASGISMTSASLYRDGHWGGDSFGNRTFQVAVETGTSYDVRVYTGDRSYGRDLLRVSIDGTFVGLSTPTSANVFTTVTLLSVSDQNSDGILDIDFSDAGGDPYWVVNGVDVAESATGLPATAPLTSGSTATTTADALTAEQLQPIVEQAVSQWTAQGLSPAQLDRLQNVDVRVSDLDAQGALGLAGSRLVLIDNDANGFGWFVDATPGDNEFRPQFGSTQLAVAGRPPAFGQMDLLTVVTHELGHIVGYGDLDPAFSHDSIMTGRLSPGIRRLPTSIDHVDLLSGLGRSQPAGYPGSGLLLGGFGDWTRSPGTEFDLLADESAYKAEQAESDDLAHDFTTDGRRLDRRTLDLLTVEQDEDQDLEDTLRETLFGQLDGGGDWLE